MKKSFVFAMFVFCVASLSAQTKGSGFDKSKLTIGGGLGMQFGDYTMINISPQVGYNFTPQFNAGAGVSYTYYKYKYNSYGTEITQRGNYAGLNVYARYYPYQYIVLLAQPEANFLWLKQESETYREPATATKFVPSFIVGAGVRLGGAVTMMLQYDLVQNDYSPYGNSLFYSVGVGF